MGPRVLSDRTPLELGLIITLLSVGLAGGLVVGQDRARVGALEARMAEELLALPGIHNGIILQSQQYTDGQMALVIQRLDDITRRLERIEAKL